MESGASEKLEKDGGRLQSFGEAFARDFVARSLPLVFSGSSTYPHTEYTHGVTEGADDG